MHPFYAETMSAKDSCKAANYDGQVLPMGVISAIGLINFYFSRAFDLAYAPASMDDVEHLDPFWRNPVNHQVVAMLQIAVKLLLGSEKTAFGMDKVFCGQLVYPVCTVLR